MLPVLVVADDLTGANAAAAGFARAGLRAVTVGVGDLSADSVQHPVERYRDRFDAVVTTTDSRHSPTAEARHRVTQDVLAGWPARLVSARIDTTLRGNVGVAAEALLDAVRSVDGGPVVGLCLAAHPAAGRVTVDGEQLLDGRRLQDTELAHDVRSPMTTSSVGDVLRRGTGLDVAHVPLSAVTGPADDLVATIIRLLDAAPDIIVGDALTVDHLERLAVAAARAGAARGVTWCGVDPGPGSVALARALELHGKATTGPRLVVSGSATALTRAQLQRLASEEDVVLVRPSTTTPPLPDVDETTSMLTAAVRQAGPETIVALVSVLDESDVVEITDAQADALPLRLGEIVRRTLQACDVSGLFTTGGDVTAAVVGALRGGGIDVEGEVVPLAVAGRLVDGEHAGLPIVTKGGLVGDTGTTVACLHELAHLATRRAREVRRLREAPFPSDPPAFTSKGASS